MSAPLPVAAPTRARLQLWIRLLRATRTIEAELRERLKTQFDTTLPRFDVMAALFREEQGMMMSRLSRFLLVSNGNVTGIVDRLSNDGLVVRAIPRDDRRAAIVRLTPKGRARFAAMAAAHAQWIDELLGNVPEEEAAMLAQTLRSFHSRWEGEA